MSGVDGGSSSLAVAAVSQSSVLDASDAKLEPGTDLVVPANFAAIAAAVEWCHHEWHRVTEPLSAEDQEGWIAAFVKAAAARRRAGRRMD